LHSGIWGEFGYLNKAKAFTLPNLYVLLLPVHWVSVKQNYSFVRMRLSSLPELPSSICWVISTAQFACCAVSVDKHEPHATEARQHQCCMAGQWSKMVLHVLHAALSFLGKTRAAVTASNIFDFICLFTLVGLLTRVWGKLLRITLGKFFSVPQYESHAGCLKRVSERAKS